MAKIKKEEEQKNAVKDIEALIKEIAIINTFLSAENPTEEYLISFQDSSNKKVKSSLICDKETINNLLISSKKNIIERISSLSAQYDIELDDEERKIIEM